MKTTNATETNRVKCDKCEGSGVINFSRLANGVCFACGGSGCFDVDMASVKITKMSRKEVIDGIKSWLDRAVTRTQFTFDCAETFINEMHGQVEYYLSHADADVRERGYAAIERLMVAEGMVQIPVHMTHIKRGVAQQEAQLLKGCRKHVVAVRRA